MPTNALHDAWMAWLAQVRPQERVTRQRGVAAFLSGLFASRSVHLSAIAAEVPGNAKLVSQERRLRRLLANAAIAPKHWFAPLAGWWLAWASRTQGEIVLIMDGSKVSGHHQLLMVALALPHGRALPIAWTWVNCAKGYSTRTKQLALLARVQALVPHGRHAAQVVLVGDTEFGTVTILEQAHEQWGWDYVLRQKGVTLVSAPAPLTGTPATPASTPPPAWQHFAALAPQPGAMRYVRQGLLTQAYGYPTALLAVWERNEKEPWLLATSLPSGAETLRYYRQRMLVEEMFGDFKGNGFDLESTRLDRIARLNRLTLFVCLLYVYLLRTGLMLLLAHTTSLVDRHDRRDLSLFQLGLRFVKRQLVNALPLQVLLCPDALDAIRLENQIKLSGT